MADMKKIVNELSINQSEKNWKSMAAAIKKSKIMYYKITFDKGKVAKKEDLRKAYAQLLDSKKNTVAKIPIFKKEKGKIRGATIYLKGLQILN